jgi:alanine dehydrogenase
LRGLKKSVKTLLLSEDDVKNLLHFNEVMPSIEHAFKMKGLGQAQMPCKQYLFFKNHNGDLRTMPSYLEESNVAAVKVVNSHSENREKYNLPSVMATIILIDPKTGAPLAIIGGTWITDLRTGIAGAIAAKYLARKNPKTIGLVGAGAQAITQIMGLLYYYKNIELVKVWSRTEKTKNKFLKTMKSTYKNETKLIPTKKISDAVQDSNIIVTTTPSTKPIVMEKWISKGTHINCIGADAPGKQELDPNILTKSKIVVDDWDQGYHSGEINVPLSKGIISKSDIWGDICEIVADLKPGRTSKNEITIFTSTGLAIQDAATANIVYKKALEKKIGKFIEYTP